MKSSRRNFTLSVLALAVGSQAGAAPRLASELVRTPGLDVTRNSNAWLEIDASAFEQNLQKVRDRLNERTRICVVMKADAYGHGISLLMPSVIRMKIPCVGVTSNEEARLVRQSGFKGQLVRLRAAPLGEMVNGMRYGVEELLGNLDVARQLAEQARRRHLTVAFHLALNSGEMARNGLEVDDEKVKQQTLEILAMPGLRPVGIMTHFAMGEADQVRAGIAEFDRDAHWLIEQAGLDRKRITLHAANSFLTLDIPEAHFDMVRPGRILYGFSTKGDFKKAMRFMTRVASVNEYPSGSGVSYSHTFVLKRDSRLANIPAGYSDGYRRAFGNKGYVLINGHRAPIVGSITMNTFMVDVTDFPDVKANDEVVLFGRQGDQEITQLELQTVIKDIMVDMSVPWGATNPKVLASRAAR
ncbi:alanine racemase [Polaromonas sp. OV174]|uniref:alanine racemase n=1 Tax=Polaromonas sp. OV174 TaxID=1855300 RepID=UPI0008E13E95|nr:alanine racemase [Polaromonas sp. OV174]SFC05829.1 alanine racemase [Polaromonas sp. OV174]